MKRQSSSGFGLVEVMLAVAIATISFCGIYVMSIQSIRILQMAKNESCSLQVAQHELEKIRGASWAQILTKGQSYYITRTEAPALAELPGSSAKVEVDYFPGGNVNNDLRAVTVYVSWVDPNGLTVTNAVTTLVARKGMLK